MLQAQIDALELANSKVVDAINKASADQAAATAAAASSIVDAINGGGFSFDKKNRARRNRSGQPFAVTTTPAPANTNTLDGPTVNQTVVDPKTGNRVMLQEGNFSDTLSKYTNSRNWKVGDVLFIGKDGDIPAIVTNDIKNPKKTGSIEVTAVDQNTGVFQYRIKAAQGGYIKNFAPGGGVSGPGTATSDSIPALLSNGEYVIKTASVNKYGVDVFDALNAGKFAMGGLFSGTPNPKPNTGGSIGVIGGNAKPAQQRKTVLETPYDSAKRLYQESNKKVVKIPVPPIRANFATNSYDLNKEQREELKAIAQQLIKSKLKSMVVQGHADSRGGVDNDLLSLNRAKATAAYLAKLVPGTSFIPVGHGVYKPLVPNTSAENMALNRRAELFLPDKYKTIYPDFNPTKHKSMLIGMGSIPATNGVLGRAIGGLIQKFANGGMSNLNYNMPSYKSGIDYIPHDQIAQLHKGERVITAQDNKNFSSGTSVMNVEMNITGSNSDDIAKKVMVELDRLQQKNNKTNKVRI